MSDRDAAVRARLKRAQGQLGGVLRMIDDGRSCDEVVAQLAAVRSAVERAALELLAGRLDDFVEQLPPEQARAAIARTVRLLGRM